MGNSQGWIRLHRKIMDTPEWLAEPFTRAQAWIDLLLLANHETGYIRKRGIMIAVERGQVGYSEEALAARWKWSKGKVRRFKAELIRLSRISIEISQKTILKNTSVSSLINIINYDLHQRNDTEDDTEDGPKTVPEQRIKRNNNKLFSSDSIEYGLSEKLISCIRERDPGFNPKSENWPVHIDRMIRLDNRDPGEIQAVIDWCQQDSFWQNNILSTEKLREKFPQLLLKMNNRKSGRKEVWEA